MTALGRLIRNRSTEKDVQDYLGNNGFQGTSARFDYLELKAVQRPGWVQVFKFRVRVLDDEGEPHQLLGVVRDDERYSTKVLITPSESELERVLAEWSEGLITLRRERSRLTPLLLAFFGLMLLAAVIGAVISP